MYISSKPTQWKKLNKICCGESSENVKNSKTFTKDFIQYRYYESIPCFWIIYIRPLELSIYVWSSSVKR